MPYKDPQKNKESKHRSYLRNKEKYYIFHKKWQEENRDKYNEMQRDYVSKNIDKVRENKKRSYLKNKEKYRIRARVRDTKKRLFPEVRLREAFSQSFRKALKDKKAGRKWETFVDYSLDELVNHLQSKFDSNMNWENYGLYWHIDHIKPMNLFDFTQPNSIKECWNLNNLQPLEARENIRKGKKYPY